MPKQKPLFESTFSDAEIAQRRDGVIRRMANTPPQPKTTIRPRKMKKKAVAGRAARKARADRES